MKFVLASLLWTVATVAASSRPEIRAYLEEPVHLETQPSVKQDEWTAIEYRVSPSRHTKSIVLEFSQMEIQDDGKLTARLADGSERNLRSTSLNEGRVSFETGSLTLVLKFREKEVQKNSIVLEGYKYSNPDAAKERVGLKDVPFVRRSSERTSFKGEKTQSTYRYRSENERGEYEVRQVKFQLKNYTDQSNVRFRIGSSDWVSLNSRNAEKFENVWMDGQSLEIKGEGDDLAMGRVSMLLRLGNGKAKEAEARFDKTWKLLQFTHEHSFPQIQNQFPCGTRNIQWTNQWSPVPMDLILIAPKSHGFSPFSAYLA